jgi:hypothetical protein
MPVEIVPVGSFYSGIAPLRFLTAQSHRTAAINHALDCPLKRRYVKFPHDRTSTARSVAGPPPLSSESGWQNASPVSTIAEHVKVFAAAMAIAGVANATARAGAQF